MHAIFPAQAIPGSFGTQVCCLFGQHLGKEEQAQQHLPFPPHGGRPPGKRSNRVSTLPFPCVRDRKDSSCLSSMLLPQDKKNYFTPDAMCYNQYKSSLGAREGQFAQQQNF